MAVVALAVQELLCVLVCVCVSPALGETLPSSRSLYGQVDNRSRKLSNPPPPTSLAAPFLWLHERLPVRETQHHCAMVVINAAAAMHGILIFLHLPLVSNLHNKTFSPFMAKRWGCIFASFLPYSGFLSLSLLTFIIFFNVLFSCAIFDLYLSFSAVFFFYFRLISFTQGARRELWSFTGTTSSLNALLASSLFFLFFSSVSHGVLTLKVCLDIFFPLFSVQKSSLTCHTHSTTSGGDGVEVSARRDFPPHTKKEKTQWSDCVVYWLCWMQYWYDGQYIW